jgi:methionyl-tRNA synthetase
MSKSKGNVVDPLTLVTSYGVDAYRYFLLREVPFGLDGAFSEEAIISRYNSDLANDLGNLLNRTLTMVEKYFEGKVPSHPHSRAGFPRSGTGNLSPGCSVLQQKATALADELEKSMPRLDFAGVLAKIWEVINIANKLIEDSKPWTLAKEKKTEELSILIYSLLEALRIISLSIYPFMPSIAKSILVQLGMKENPEDCKLSDIKTWGGLKSGGKVNKSKPLFPRIET